MKQCSVTYQGETYPTFQGARCVRDAPHDGKRHFALVQDRPLQWWTEEEKRQQRAKRDIYKEKP